MRGGHVAQAWPLALVFHAPLRRLLQARVMQSDRNWDPALWPNLVAREVLPRLWSAV